MACAAVTATGNQISHVLGLSLSLQLAVCKTYSRNILPTRIVTRPRYINRFCRFWVSVPQDLSTDFEDLSVIDQEQSST